MPRNSARHAFVRLKGTITEPLSRLWFVRTRANVLSSLGNAPSSMYERKRPVVILDRDGTIITDKRYLSDPEGVQLLRSSAEGLQRLQELGLPIVVVTNQSGVGRGLFTMRHVNAVNQRMIELLRAQGVELAGIFVCPHEPARCCDCRKPRLGLVRAAALDLKLSLATTFVIGDNACDI